VVTDPHTVGIFLTLLLAGPFGGLLYSLRQSEITLPKWSADGKLNLGMPSDMAFGIAGSFVIFLLMPGQVAADSWMFPKIWR
jgi:hypothetical protein